MVTIIKTEFMKLKRYFIVWIGVSLMLLTVLLTLFTTMADDGMVWDYQFLFEQVVKHFVTMIFPMCITLISGYMISREYTDDTLKNIETLPISFRKLLAGKLIVSAILSLFLGIVCFVFTVIANFIMGYAHFILGMTKQDIARAEGVHEKVVRVAIERGLRRLEKILKISL